MTLYDWGNVDLKGWGDDRNLQYIPLGPEGTRKEHLYNCVRLFRSEANPAAGAVCHSPSPNFLQQHFFSSFTVQPPMSQSLCSSSGE